jgi:hypothetical protein
MIFYGAALLGLALAAIVAELLPVKESLLSEYIDGSYKFD